MITYIIETTTVLVHNREQNFPNNTLLYVQNFKWHIFCKFLCLIECLTNFSSSKINTYISGFVQCSSAKITYVPQKFDCVYGTQHYTNTAKL